MKICIICKIEQLESCYHKDKSRSDGLNPRCKTCKKVVDANYRKNNKAKINENNRIYYTNNSEKIINRANVWYNENREQALETR